MAYDSVKIQVTWLGGEVVTRRSAKPLCRGSIPLQASTDVP